MCTYKRITVQSNYGALVAYVHQDSVRHPQSDSEESTEPVVMNDRKPIILETGMSSMSAADTSPQSYCDYDMWGECDDELKTIQEEIQLSSSSSSEVEEDVWWQMNKDFALDNSQDIEEEATSVIKTHSSAPASMAYADYDMYGECDGDTMEVVNSTKPAQEETHPAMDEDVWWQMNKEFARDGLDEYYVPSKKSVVVKKDMVRDATTSPDSVIKEVEWMEINKDFARDNDDHMETIHSPASPSSLPQQPCGDYDIWGERE